jgi:lipopolysaccharide/colanic/teichoic acid biosynthesis glycosyltransferase
MFRHPKQSMRNKPPTEDSPIDRSVQMPGWKRVVDVTCGLAALPVLALLTLLTAIVMKLTSPGPVFFRQERVGYREKRFMCYKFRTMLVGADPRSHQTHSDYLIQSNAPMVKMDSRGDSRLVPGGWLIRASGLDELPQIINVLRGEMSLVGPRPCVPYESEKYQPWERERFNAVPGLTGLWQVSGKNRTTFEEMMRLDIRYARNVSWWLDLKIILMTVPALLLQIRDARRGRKSRAQSKQSAAGIPGGERESIESRRGLNQPRMEGNYSPEVTP